MPGVDLFPDLALHEIEQHGANHEIDGHAKPDLLPVLEPRLGGR